jgi:nitroimidazol reductase NimA-like FMN-containing flavoprotein (pyridoxamine 5'-phosphate oxidase superfamily)
MLLSFEELQPEFGARMTPMPKRRNARAARRAQIRRSNSASTVEPAADRPHAPGYGIVGPKDGKGLLPWSWVERKMSRCHTFWLATIYGAAINAGPHSASRPRPHVMPLWGVWVENAFYFSTGRTSRKGQNLAASPACTVTNDDGMEAVIVEGRAEEVTASAELEKMAVAYKKKYKMDPRSMNEPIFKLEPAKVFAFIEKSFPKSATRWRM